MGLDCRYAHVGPLLHATFRGTFAVAEAKLAYRGVLEECIAHGSSLVLLDCRQMDGRLTTVERFDFAEFVAREHLGAVDAGRMPPVRMAFLGRIPLIDAQRFGETVALNRGAWVKATTDLDEAVQWLGIDPSTLASPGPGD